MANRKNVLSLWLFAPVTYAVAPTNNGQARLATDGNTTFAVWSTPAALLGARVSRDGAILDVPPRLVAEGTAWYDSRWQVAWVGGHYLVVWTRKNGLFARRLGGQGNGAEDNLFLAMPAVARLVRILVPRRRSVWGGLSGAGRPGWRLGHPHARGGCAGPRASSSACVGLIAASWMGVACGA